MKEYVIHVTKTEPELDGEWAVFFTTETTTSGREITFCSVRHGIGHQPYSGCSVKHPKDTENEMRGMQESFKRAVQAMLDKRNSMTVVTKVEGIWSGGWNHITTVCEPKDTSNIMSRFRGALWIAMGRPGYKKEIPTVDLSGKTQYVVNVPIR